MEERVNALIIDGKLAYSVPKWVLREEFDTPFLFSGRERRERKRDWSSDCFSFGLLSVVVVEVAAASVRLRLEVDDTLAGAERLGGMITCYIHF